MRSKLEYLNGYKGKSPSAHRSALKSFLEFTLKDKINSSADLEVYAARYLNKNQSTENLEDDIKDFFATMVECPPKTTLTYISYVKSFFRANRIRFDDDFWKNDVTSKVKGRKAWTIDKIPSVDELKSILTHQDAMGKAIILMLLSSGMRPGELVQIKETNVDFGLDPVPVFLSGSITKNGESRTVFISQEAVGALKEWLKIRKDHVIGMQMRGSNKKHPREIKPDDGRIFPVTTGDLDLIWNLSLAKVGLTKIDEKTRRNTLHLYTLRKFFNSRMKSANVPEAVVQSWMGHEGYLGESYDRIPDEEVRKHYKDHEDCVSVYSNGAEIKQFNQEKGQLQTVVNSLVAENQFFKSKFDKLERIVDELLVSFSKSIPISN
jgi:integrase